MRPSYCLLLFAYHLVTGLSLPATYDQRQTGDLNVQVHLKDVQVLALLDSELLDDYTEYDYFYDYADFTLKPTAKPTTSTTESLFSETTENVSSENSTVLSSTQGSSNTVENFTIPVPMVSEKINETLSNENVEDSISINDTSNVTVHNQTESSLDDIEEDSAEKIEEGSSTKGPSTRLSQKRCRTGYSRNGNGRCRRLSRRKLSLIPLAIKLAPKLLDDLSRTTKNLAQEEVHRMRSN